MLCFGSVRIQFRQDFWQQFLAGRGFFHKFGQNVFFWNDSGDCRRCTSASLLRFFDAHAASVRRLRLAVPSDFTDPLYTGHDFYTFSYLAGFREGNSFFDDDFCLDDAFLRRIQCWSADVFFGCDVCFVCFLQFVSYFEGEQIIRIFFIGIFFCMCNVHSLLHDDPYNDFLFFSVTFRADKKAKKDKNSRGGQYDRKRIIICRRWN